MPSGSGPGAIASAAGWLQGTLLGTAATVVAIIAVATVGLMMLSGRIDIRRAAQVVLGCFIIFGASAIAGGILSATNPNGDGAGVPVAQLPPPPPAYPDATAVQYDPYAGAAVRSN